jgi:hypothetical protein
MTKVPQIKLLKKKRHRCTQGSVKHGGNLCCRFKWNRNSSRDRYSKKNPSNFQISGIFRSAPRSVAALREVQGDRDRRGSGLGRAPDARVPGPGHRGRHRREYRKSGQNPVAHARLG